MAFARQVRGVSIRLRGHRIFPHSYVPASICGGLNFALLFSCLHSSEIYAAIICVAQWESYIGIIEPSGSSNLIFIIGSRVVVMGVAYGSLLITCSVMGS